MQDSSDSNYLRKQEDRPIRPAWSGSWRSSSLLSCARHVGSGPFACSGALLKQGTVFAALGVRLVLTLPCRSVVGDQNGLRPFEFRMRISRIIVVQGRFAA